MSERVTTVIAPNEVDAAWALHEATGKVGTGEVVYNGSLNGSLIDDYTTTVRSLETEVPTNPFDIAVSLLDEFHGLKSKANRMSPADFEGMASAFEDACLEVIGSSDKTTDEKREYVRELTDYISRYRSINGGRAVRETKATTENESRIDELFPLDAEAEATRKVRADKAAVRGPINVTNLKSKGVLTSEELNDADRRSESFAGLKAGIQAAHKERTDRKTADYKAKAIETRKNSAEINALNEDSRANIYGSGDRKFFDAAGNEIPASSGKLYAMLRDPKFGDTRAEREASVRQYKADVEGLLADGFELCQAELILELRQRDKDHIAQVLDARMIEGRDVKPPKKELTEKQQEDLDKSLLNPGSTTKTTAERLYEEAEKADEERLKLMREGGAFTYSDLQAVKAGRELYPMPANTKVLVSVNPNTTKLLDRAGIRREIIRKQHERETLLLNGLDKAIDAYNEAGKADNAKEAQAEAIGPVVGLMGQIKETFSPDSLTPEVEKQWRDRVAERLGLSEGQADQLDADKKTPEELQDARLAELAEMFKAAVANNDEAAEIKARDEVKAILQDKFTNKTTGKLNDAKFYKASLEWLETAGDGLTEESYAAQYDKFKSQARIAEKKGNLAEATRLRARAKMLAKQYTENGKWEEVDRREYLDVVSKDLRKTTFKDRMYDYRNRDKAPKHVRNRRIAVLLGAGLLAAVLLHGRGGDGGAGSETPRLTVTSVEHTVPGGGLVTTTTKLPGAAGAGGSGSAISAERAEQLSKPFTIEAGHGYTQEIADAFPGLTPGAYTAAHEAALLKFGPDYLKGVPKYKDAKTGEMRLSEPGTGTWDPAVVSFLQQNLSR